MTRMMIMLAASATAVLLFAQAAWAQPPGGLSPSGVPTPSLPYQAQPLSPLQIQQGVGSIPQDATVTPDATASPEATASPDATASPSASPDATASPSASPSTTEELPDTGGPSPGAPLAVVAALVLLVSGLAAAGLVRGHGAAS